MRLSSRSKLSILLSAVTFVAIIGAIVLTALVPRGTATHAAASGTGPRSAVGHTTRRRSSSLASFNGPSNLRSHSEVPQFNPLANKSVPAVPISSVPSGQAVSLADPPGALLQNFNGVSSRDSATVNGFDVEPPDQGLCVGPLAAAGGQKVVVEPVNLAVTFYSASGTKLFGPFPDSFLFAEPSGTFLSDPRCIFDPATGDFFFTITAFTSTSSHFDVTVLIQDAVGSFFVYRFNTTNDGTGGPPAVTEPGCPCIGDQPHLGVDQNNIYVTTDEFNLASVFGNAPEIFFGANVYAISKSQLAALSTVNFAFFLRLIDAGIPVFRLQPAISTGNAPAEYLVHSFALDSSGNPTAGDHRLGVFALTNGQVVSSGGIPTLSIPTVIQSETYSQPQPAHSTGGVVLDPGFDSLQQVQFTHGLLWTALDTGFRIPICDQGVCDAAAWFEIFPVVSNGQFIGAAVSKQGYVAVRNTNVLYPAFAESSDGINEMAFSITSPTLNPSAAYAVQVDSSPLGFTQVFIAATGTGPDTGISCTGSAAPGCRWGDYSAAALDSNSGNIWLATEYIPPASSQSDLVNWGTRVYEVSA